MNRPRGSVRYDNAGRIVLVTGGCNGIGHAVSVAFHQSHAQVIVADLDPVAAAQLPPDIVFHRTDVAQPDQCEGVVAAAIQRFGAIDVLVNNAAIQPPQSYTRVDQLDASIYQQMVDVNLSGYTWMAKYVLREMRKQASGVVINMASGQGHRTARHVPVYGPIKAANVLQAMQWGVEFARDGIRVVSVSPGAIDTPMVRATLQAQGGADQLANRHPVGRIGTPAEVANAVLWLASDDASFVTATDLAVDGGLDAFGAFADPF